MLMNFPYTIKNAGRNLLLLSLIAFFLIFSVSGCSSSRGIIDEDDSPSNIEQIDKCIEAIFLKFNSSLEQNKPVYYIIAPEAGLSKRHIDNRLIELLSSKGYTVFQEAEEFAINSGSGEKAGTGLLITSETIEISYKKPDNKISSPQKKLSRITEVQVFCKIFSTGDGRIISAESHNEKLSDFIDANEISGLQSDELPFTAGTNKVKKSRLHTFLETGSVVTAASVIIYLLFSTRS